ncbi:carbonic anhydrase 2, partial [Folsomia candida]|uniref:carbonic anhydrase 2 n=1 Tax=Folsomia candida TaxID=158441 RepID=UPI001605188D
IKLYFENYFKNLIKFNDKNIGLTKTKYRLSNAHFHWGKTDSDGSEHALEGKRFAMEMHLVHYNEKYGSAAKAIKSGDADALSVIGIFFNAVKGADPNPALAPILKGIASIKDVHSYWVKVEEPIDMMPLLPHRGDPIFHYKGSLTTPTCNEQVNWYVFKTPITVSPSDVNAFRSLVDGHNRTLIENHRPVQSLGSRDVKMLKVH